MLTYFGKIRLFNSNVRLLLLATLVVGFTIDGGIFNVIMSYAVEISQPKLNHEDTEFTEFLMNFSVRFASVPLWLFFY